MLDPQKKIARPGARDELSILCTLASISFWDPRVGTQGEHSPDPTLSCFVIFVSTILCSILAMLFLCSVFALNDSRCTFFYREMPCVAGGRVPPMPNEPLECRIGGKKWATQDPEPGHQNPDTRLALAHGA